MIEKKPLVMIVEDEKDLAENIKEIVESSKKYAGITAYSAADALRILEEHKTPGGGNKIKCILLDIKMPEMDGLQFLDEIRKRYKEEIGVIMETAYEDDEKWSRSLHGKVLGYLKKPFTSDQILKTLDAAFEGEEARRGMRILTYDQYFEEYKKYKREE